MDTRAALVVEVTGSRRGHPVFLGPASVSPDGYDLAYDERNAPRRSTARQASRLASIAVWRALNLPEKPNQPLQQMRRANPHGYSANFKEVSPRTLLTPQHQLSSSAK